MQLRVVLPMMPVRNYVEEAFRCVNLIRERAGATLLASSAETSIDVVRIERRKELASKINLLGFEALAYY